MFKKLAIFFLLCITAGLVFLHFSFPVIERPNSTAESAQTNQLLEKNHTIYYAPGETAGVPMRFDRLLLTSYHAIRYFADNGYVGYKDYEKNTINSNWLTHIGFPIIKLRLSSLPVPIQLCDKQLRYSVAMEKQCPTDEITLESSSNLQQKIAKILQGHQTFANDESSENSENILPKYRAITQWAAFFTEKSDTSAVNDQWLGWQCNSERIEKQNTQLATWGSTVNTWGQNPYFYQSACYQTDDTVQDWLAQYVPSRARISEHPVLWQCAPVSSQQGECAAYFIHQQRLITLKIPRPAIKGRSADGFDRQRHLIVQGAWQWLQNAAQRAENQTDFNVGEALEKEMAFCEQLDNVGKARLAQGGKIAKAVRAWWDDGHHAVTSIYPRSVCAKAMHRILQMRESTAENTALNSLNDEQILVIVRRLIDIEGRYETVSQPLKALLHDYLKKVHGENSPELFSSIMTDQYIFKSPEAALERYLAMGHGINDLPAEQRMRIRRQLSHRLWGDFKQHNIIRRELMWAVARELTVAKDALPYRDQLDTLKMSMIYRQNRDIQANERVPSSEDLTLRLADLAKTIAADTQLSPKAKRYQIALAGIYAAWQANQLVVDAYEKQQPDVAQRWQVWLHNWAEWVMQTLNVDKNAYNNPHWVDAIYTHVEAAKAHRMTEPNCAGGQYNGCRLALFP